jgi:8-oxo-dGTP diphosphatase
MSYDKLEKKQIIALKAIIKKDGRFLILLRAKNEKAFPELWDFPGGKLEEGENPLQSLAREVKEETGLTVRAKNVEGTYESDLNGTPVKFTIYAVDVLSGDPEHIVIGEEHSEYRLATAEEIRNLKAMPYMEDYLEPIH